MGRWWAHSVVQLFAQYGARFGVNLELYAEALGVGRIGFPHAVVQLQIVDAAVTGLQQQLGDLGGAQGGRGAAG